MAFGDIHIAVEGRNASQEQIASAVAKSVAPMELKMIQTRAGQRAVYSAVGLKAGRNAGKIRRSALTRLPHCKQRVKLWNLLIYVDVGVKYWKIRAIYYLVIKYILSHIVRQYIRAL